jgi:threonine/homoserine/homoserine lactone efflux protein
VLFLCKGLIIGILIAAPLGPVGLLCVRRTLTHGRLSGQLSGLGAATAHSFYGLLAGLGIAGVSSFLLKSQAVLGIVGGLFLCYLGIKTFRTRPADHSVSTHGVKRIQNYASTLALAVTNPLTIMSFVSIFVGFGVKAEHYFDPLLLMVGIFLGSMVWWLSLTFVVSLFRHRMNARSLLLINKASGLFIFAFGIASLMRA